jgi:hypothetical protein
MEHATLLVKNSALSLSEPPPKSHLRREGGALHTLMTQGAPAKLGYGIAARILQIK